jgi:hypothetical protein
VVHLKASCACAAPTLFKVVKIDMTRPFCIQHHVDICPNTSNSGGVLDSDQKFSMGIQYTPTMGWQLKFFRQCNVSDQKIWSPQGLVIEKIQSPYHVAIENFHNCHKVWQPNFSITIKFTTNQMGQV